MPYVQTFDGLEGAPAPCAVPCAGCGTALAFDLWDVVGRARSGWQLTDDEAAAAGLTRRAHRGIVSTTVTPDGPAAYVGALRCPTCAHERPVVVGLGEFQPGRYVGGVVLP